MSSGAQPVESERLAVAIPAYQAEPSVGRVVAGACEVLPEVLVVDDGSTDGTAEVARSAGARVVSHPANRGKGAALRTAFDELFGRGFDAVITVDADGQHLAEEIPALVRGLEAGGDLVLGTRDRLFGEMSALRRTSNRTSSIVISAVAGQRLGDVQTGFRAYRRELIAAVGFPETGFEAESAVVVRAARGGFALIETPVRLGFADGRCTSFYRPVADSLRIAGAVIRARMETTGWAWREER